MPYYIYTRGEAVDYGTPYATKADAVSARVGDQCIGFVANYAERHAWMRREDARLTPAADATTHYRPLPFFTPWAHYAHHAKNAVGKIAYTPDDTYGHEDRQLVMTIGRYLEKHGAEMGVPREDWPLLIEKVQRVDDPPVEVKSALRFATTADEIGRVYCAPRGPASCMDGSHRWDWRTAPARAYAGGDLAVAYLGELGSSPDQDHITGRAVVWLAQKAWVRVYGANTDPDTNNGTDMDTMRAELEAAGFQKRRGWDGARIPAVSRRTGDYLMPYIDGAHQNAVLDQHAKFFILGHDGPYECCSTGGYIQAQEQHYCGNEGCEEQIDEDETYCADCGDARWYCTRCDSESFCSDDAYNGTNGLLCEGCYDEDSRTCEACNDSYNTNDWSSARLRTMRNLGIEHLCWDCRDRQRCPECDTWTDSELQQHGGEGDEICKDCRVVLSMPVKRRKPRTLLLRQTASELFVAPALQPAFVSDLTTTEILGHLGVTL